MSRFIEVLNEHRGEVTIRTLPALLADLRDRLQAQRAHIAVEFPYFVERTAPESRARALMDYACAFRAEASDEGDDFVLSVRVPVASVCPCSKAISDYGAHNQRGYLTIEVRTVRSDDGRPELVWIEELIDLAEQSASAPVYPLVKRIDERRLTMQAYDNPVFVEDMVRNAAERLDKDRRVAWFRVHVRNDESIHNHSVFAQIERDRVFPRRSDNLFEHSAGLIGAREGGA
jgi:GTP cyclohydrolase I